MYQLMRQRHGIGSVAQDSDDEGEELQLFMSDFDLHKQGEQGFIKHHVAKLLDNSADAPISASLDIKLTLPSSSNKNSSSSIPQPDEGGEDTDDERDELDLIGNSQKDVAEESSKSTRASSHSSKTHREDEQPAEVKMKETTKDKVEGEAVMNVEAHTSSTPSELVYPAIPRSTKSEARTEALFTPTSQKDTQQPERVPLKATPTEVGISPSLFIAHRSPIVIPAPLEPSLSIEQSTVVVTPLPNQALPAEMPELHNFHKIDYTLPHPSILPAEFNRKKASKRKKDRSDKKSDDLPMGFNRWAASVIANPVYTRMKRSTKCLSTKDWSVAIAELRLIRTVERIEKLKAEGRWSFRQTKKQRGVGGLMKTHWDYLMDEMKWMRTDFREERKWKLALAYNISTAVLEWHALKSWDERVAHGVCVKWKPVEEDIEQGVLDSGMDIDQEAVDVTMEEPEESRQSSKSLLNVDYTSDDDDMDNEAIDPKDVINPLDTNAEIQGALDGTDDLKEEENARAEAKEAEAAAAVKPKQEDLDDASALQVGDTDVKQDLQDTEVIGLKATSKDPMLGSKSSSHSVNGDTDENKANLTKGKISAYAPMREKIVYGPSDKLFIGPEDLDSFPHLGARDSAENDILHALGLDTLFPELQPFGMLDVAPPVVPEPTKKRSSRSADKDDPNKRVEETNYTKVLPSNQFMTVKPTLLGPLEPAKRWKDGHWLPMEEYAIPADPDSTSRITEESLCELFDFKVKTGKGDGLQPKDLRQPRNNDQHWSTNDELLLKSLIDRYPGNWNLIAECFNGARLTTPSDRRTAGDCQDKWRAKWASDLQAKSLVSHNDSQPDEQGQASGSNADGELIPTVTPSTSMTTRGVKRLASASVSSQQAPSLAAGSDPKKRRRHFHIGESVRKASRKRQEQVQKNLTNQRKPQAQMHDTHIQLHKLPKVTPAELSRQKAEREAAQLAELQKARARQDELTAKNAPRLAGVPQPIAPQSQAALQTAHPQQSQPQPQGQLQTQAGPSTQPIPQLTPQQMQHQLLLQAQARAAAQNQAQVGQANQAGSVASQLQGTNVIARISTPSAPAGVAGGTRLTSQQILQLQNSRSLSAHMAGSASTTAMNGNTTASSLVNRDPTASPAHGVNSPHLNGTIGANSPSPATVGQTVLSAPSGTNTGRLSNGHYLGFSPDQQQMASLNQLRMHMMMQQQAAQQLREQQNQQQQGQQGQGQG
ncbi:hypothetical protein DFP72DRAFT_870046 [Ephemerocybe angulata]|uniref:Vacuolar import and degradation protein 21 n=1 Tax=Ephemerocybe angulata TaxID=980116 RepID=A0A8H6ME02_9AGAR|nr:hypothetical protein DFP72DRAFT_870046 [Tulosesus angulatus]